MNLFYQDSSCTLYNGNMLDMLDNIEPNSVDSIVTDPPYGLTSIVKRFGKEGSAPAKYGKDGSFARLSKGFLGKEWDGSGIEYNVDAWKKCYEVLKPGGYLLAFGGSRTFYRIACAMEDAGFEIRDTIMWLYGSGFPKSFNIGLAIDKKNGVESPVVGQNADILKKQAKDLREGHRKIKDSYDLGDENRNNGFTTVSADIKEAQNQWRGWGTCLKPAYEPIIVARKPPIGSLVDNVIEYGVGGINIEECRIPLEDDYQYKETIRSTRNNDTSVFSSDSVGFKNENNTLASASPDGRFPSNVILTYDETDKEEVCGGFPDSDGCRPHKVYSNVEKYDGWGTITQKNGELVGYDDDGGSAARYFYCAKASKKDREDGCGNLPDAYSAMSNQAKAELKRGNLDFIGSEDKPVFNAFNSVNIVKNNHPTVKPTELMQYLVRLVTPNGGTILDPFNGSGSTGKAVMYENNERNKNYKYIGIELDKEYLEISKARIKFAQNVALNQALGGFTADKKKSNQASLW